MKTLMLQGTFTAKTPISYVSPDASKGQLPRLNNRLYLTATSIRSIVRHAAVEHMIDLSGSRPVLDDYYLMVNGGVMDAKAKEDLNVIQRLRYAQKHNPLVSLFGSMRYGVPGALYCGHALADPNATVHTFSFTRGNEFQRNPELVEKLDENAWDDNQERNESARARSQQKRKIAELVRAERTARNEGDDARLAELREQRAQAEQELEGMPTVSDQQIQNYPCIAQDTVFEHQFILENVSDIEIALFMKALDRVAMSPFIGGKRAHGLGRFAAQWAVRGRNKGERVMRDLGTLVIDGDLNPLQVAGEIETFLKDEWLEVPMRQGLFNLTENGMREMVQAEAA